MKLGLVLQLSIFGRRLVCLFHVLIPKSYGQPFYKSLKACFIRLVVLQNCISRRKYATSTMSHCPVDNCFF